jgi:prepilin-type N-terminal cleavage/methylation domain-containing protein
MQNSENGFTLIELSIVLVIIGLITGGIVGGQSLMKAAGERKFLNEMQSYESIVYIFEDQYDSLPGDMTDAESYWPVDCVDATGDACNGNGDGKVDDVSGNREQYRFWQHLALGDFIPGEYRGQYEWRADNNACGIEHPCTKDMGGGIMCIQPRITITYTAKAQNFRIGNRSSISCTRGFSVETLIRLDKKYDDGVASTGKILTSSTTCSLGAGAWTDYDISTPGTPCNMHYLWGKGYK